MNNQKDLIGFESLKRESERQLIAGILYESKWLGQFDLGPNDFLDPVCRNLFSFMQDMQSKNQFIDTSTVLDYVQQKHENNTYLYHQVIEIASGFISHYGMENYAKAIKRDSLSEKLKDIGQKITDIGETFDTFENKLEKALSLFDGFSNLDNSELANQADCVKEFMQSLEDRKNSDKELQGLSSGITTLDKRLGGFNPSDLIILAGRPGQGKTTLALNMALSAAREDKNVLFFSLEMPKIQLSDKNVSSMTNIEIMKIKRGRLQGDDYKRISDAVKELKTKNLLVDDNSQQTIQSISIRAKKAKFKYEKIDLIVIDYIQLIGSNLKANRVEQISEITRGLKLLAKELDCPIIALSQLSRNVEQRADKRPLMSDLRDSGSIEQDADVVLFVYRDEYYYPDEPNNKGIAEIITAKFRNGEPGKDLVECRLNHSKFFDLIAKPKYEPHINYAQQSTEGFR